MQKNLLLLALSLGMYSQSAVAMPQLARLTPELKACISKASKAHAVPAPIMLAIGIVESGLQTRAIRSPFAAGNIDGTTDYGAWQINSQHLAEIAKTEAATTHAVRKRLTTDICYNAHHGARILAEKIAIHGPNWHAVGAYNAGSRDTETHRHLRAVYASKVAGALKQTAHIDFGSSNKSFDATPDSTALPVRVQAGHAGQDQRPTSSLTQVVYKPTLTAPTHAWRLAVYESHSEEAQ